MVGMSELWKQFGYDGPRLLVLSGLHTGPRVLANSIPKSGTNLLIRTLSLLSPLRRKLMRTLNESLNPARLDARIRSIRAGEFAAAHLKYTPELAACISDAGVKHVLMVRDPRDIAISNVVYITHKDAGHRLHHYYHDVLKSDDERLEATLKGISAENLPDQRAALGLHTHLIGFSGWLDQPNCHLVRFEDLVGPCGGGATEAQQRALRDLARFLSIPLSDESIGPLAARLFDQSSRTFHKGQIGTWRDGFTAAARAEFWHENAEIMHKLGYED